MAHVIDLTQIGIVIFTSQEDASKQFICKHEAETEFQMTGSKSIRATLKSVSYTKKIYEPCSLTCTIQLESIDKTVTPIEDVIQLARSFKGKRVSAYRGDTTNSIAENYFVYRSIPTHEKDDAVSVKLEIYSMDKLLDTMSYSRSYVSRKLRAEILGDAIARCKYGDLIVPVADNDELQYTSYNDHKNEFVQPYIVQFNETPYSMLRRTANRSGEFLFFEDGGIHLGLPKTTTIPVVGNAEEDQIHFKSVSYSDSIASDFGKDLQYQADDYQHANGEEYYSTLLEYAEAPFTMHLDLMEKCIKDPKEKEKFKAVCDLFGLNQKYRGLYERAKNAVNSYKCLSASLQKKQQEKAELCDEKDPKEPSQKAIIENAPIYLKMRQSNLQDQLKQKEEELKQLEDDKKKYLALEAECQALKDDWQNAPKEPAIEKQKKYTLYSEKQAELNLLIEKKKGLKDLTPQIDAHLVEIIALKDELTALRNAIGTLESPNKTEAQKQKALAPYEEDVKKPVREKIERLQTDIDEIQKTIDRLKEEPEILKQHKGEAKWIKFAEWSEFFGANADKKLAGIWKDVLGEGSNLYPLNIKEVTAGIKSYADKIMNGGIELDKQAAQGKDLKKTCEAVISYCEAMAASTPKEVKSEASVYHMEYGNDEYLETFKKDQTGTLDDVYFSDYSSQETPWYVDTAKFIFHFFAQILNDSSAIGTSFASYSYLNAQAVGIDAIVLALQHSHYNETYLTNYKHNGKDVRNTEYGGSDEISLFATYNKKTQVETSNSAFSAIFYKEIWKAEKRVTDQKIIIHIDTAVNKVSPKLGQKIQYGDKTYIITSITGTRSSESHGLISEEIVEAIPQVEITDKISLFIPPVSGYPRYVKAEPQLATVVDDDDPSFYARVRVRYKWQPGGKEKDGDEPSPWIRVSTPFASHGGGMLFIPKPGNQVMIDYENGNIERPFVSNAVYNADNLPPMPIVNKKPTRMMISSPNGHSIRFSDTSVVSTIAGAFSSFAPVMSAAAPALAKKWEANKWAVNPGGGVTISDSYGFYSISCSADKRAINISSPLGSIGLSAFTGIKISAPNGDIKIEGKNVTIAANNEVKIVSGVTVKNKIDSSKVNATMPARVVNSIVKSVADILPSAIDLSLLRYIFERMVPPVSGAMSIKSYRFLLIDAGASDFNAEQIQTNSSSRQQLKIDPKKKFKGWRDLKGENEVGLSTETLDAMIVDNFRTSFGNLVKNVLKEKNNWRVDSEKNAIIFAGNTYHTSDDNKKALTQDVKSENVIPEDSNHFVDSNNHGREWNLAATAAPSDLKKTKIVGGIIGHIVSAVVLTLIALPIEMVGNFGRYIIGRKKSAANALAGGGEEPENLQIKQEQSEDSKKKVFEESKLLSEDAPREQLLLNRTGLMSERNFDEEDLSEESNDNKSEDSYSFKLKIVGEKD